MSASKYRIPRLAVAALVLGACGDDDGDSKAGVNISDARVHSLAQASCKQYAECEPDEFTESYESQADCVASYESDFDMYVETYGKECMDAYLDWAECASALACNEDEDEKCAAEDKKADELCDDGEEDEDASSTQNAVRFPALRIPR